jgi:DNA-directed RNA polymerase beta' subunit
VSVNNDGLVILNWLKIQSDPDSKGQVAHDEPVKRFMEMNMHMPQNILAETELKHLAAIPYQMISPSANSPIIGIYQDSLLGSYRFTRPNQVFTARDAMNLLMMYSKVDVAAIREKGDKITNFDILSQILAPITIMYKTKLFEEDETFADSNNVLEIRNGKYIRGQIEKSVLASTSKGIIHRICNDFGHIHASNFIDDLQNVVTEYMKSSSFSVGISDLIANKKTQDDIINVITAQKQEVQSLIDKVHLGIFENNTAATNMAEFENNVNNILNDATNQAGKIGRKSLDKTNRFVMIVNSGSKGTLINISQMISCLGQTSVDGKRIPYGFDNRTLPHFSKYDDSPNARGFIENSYISGLTAPELFFHAMGGRIGLIDTAVKTSQTGYIQRRLIKGLEDLKVEYDLTVRNNKGRIVQFAYGDDGFDSTRVENQIIPLVAMTTEDIYLHYDLIGVNEKKSATDLLEVYTKGTITRINQQKSDTMKKCQTYIRFMLDSASSIVENVFKNKNENTVKIPVAFQSLISNIQGQLNLNANSSVDITPLEAFELIESYYKKLENLTYAKPTPLFEVLYHFYLSPKELLVHKRFHRKALVILLEMVLLKYKQAIVHPGEMVGVIAGQSLGEPTTQLSLLRTEKIKIMRIDKKTRQTAEIVSGEIGNICDDIIRQLPDYTFNTGHIDSVETILEPLDHEYFIVGVDEKEKTHWNKISHVSRHIVNGDMVRVTTKSGRVVETTMSHSHLIRKDQTVQPILGSDLKIGMRIPVAKNIENTFVVGSVNIKGNDYLLTREMGYKIGHQKIAVPPFAFLAPEEFKSGFLAGFFAGNLQVAHDDEQRIKDVALLLNYFGIFGVLDVNDECRYRVTVPVKYAQEFKRVIDVNIDLESLGVGSADVDIDNIDKINGISGVVGDCLDAFGFHKYNGFENMEMGRSSLKKYIEIIEKEMARYSSSSSSSSNMDRAALNHNIAILKQAADSSVVWDKIVKIEQYTPKQTEYVYDFTVPGNQTFMTDYGIIVHNTLNTFHLSGVASKSNVTRGVPRIEEILRLTKNPKNPSLTVHLKPIDELLQEKATQYSNMLEHTKLYDVVRSVQICFDPNDRSTEIMEDRLLMEQYYMFEDMLQECIEGAGEPAHKSKWIIRMELDTETLLDKNITMDDIHFAITSVHGDDISCVFSDFNSKNLVFRIRLNSSIFTKSKKQKGIPDTLDQSDEIYMLRNFQETLLNNIVLRGVQGIRNVIPRKLQNYVVKEDGKYSKKDVWILDTTGTNLMSIMALDYIDAMRTYSNDINEIFNVLGLEAARQVVYNEFVEVMEFSDVYINYHHLSLLCDRMTMTQNMVSIFRSGILNDDIGPISKSTFEVHTEVLLDASRHAEFDHMRGVSASVMMGQMGNFGTGSFQVILDMEKMKTMTAQEVDVRDKQKEIDRLFGGLEEADDMCSKANIEIKNNLEALKAMEAGEGVCDDDDDGYDMGF